MNLFISGQYWIWDIAKSYPDKSIKPLFLTSKFNCIPGSYFIVTQPVKKCVKI
jgi:hypothetical protein